MAESMWDAALKGAAFGEKVGDRFTRFNANRKASKLEKEIEDNPELTNEIQRQRAYAQGIADITQAARGRGIDLEGELLDRYDENRGREGVRQRGEQVLGLGGASIAPQPGDAAAAAGAPLGAAPINPPATPMGRAAPNFRGAADTGAEFSYAGGNAEAGDMYAQQGRNIDIGAAAMKRDPVTGKTGFDTATAAQGIAQDQAAQGNLPQAQAAQDANTTAVQKLGQQYFGMAFQELAQESPSKDRVEATINEGLKMTPQLGYDRSIYDPEKKTLTMMRGAQAMHEMPVGTPADMEKLTSAFSRYSQDPGSYLANLQQTMLADAAAEKTEAGAARGKILDATLENIKQFPKDPRGVLSSTLSEIGKAAGGGGKDGGGFDVEKLDIDGPSTFKVGNEILTITRADEDTKLPPGVKFTPNMLIVQKPDGSTTTIEKAFEEKGVKVELASQLQRLMTNVYKENLLQRGADFSTAQKMLNDLARGYGATVTAPESGGARGGTGGKPAIGGDTQKFPIEETDNYVRSIIGKAGRPTGTNAEVVDKIFPALLNQESGKQGQKAKSSKGALGVAQLMPDTAREMEKKLGMKPGITDTDADANEKAGKAYLLEQMEKYDGNLELALAAYNAGPGNVDSWLKAGKVAAGGTAEAPAMGGFDTAAPAATATAAAPAPAPGLPDTAKKAPAKEAPVGSPMSKADKVTARQSESVMKVQAAEQALAEAEAPIAALREQAAARQGRYSPGGPSLDADEQAVMNELVEARDKAAETLANETKILRAASASAKKQGEQRSAMSRREAIKRRAMGGGEEAAPAGGGDEYTPQSFRNENPVSKALFDRYSKNIQ